MARGLGAPAALASAWPSVNHVATQHELRYCRPIEGAAIPDLAAFSLLFTAALPCSKLVVSAMSLQRNLLSKINIPQHSPPVITGFRPADRAGQ
jgi:hypothetical protein